VQELRSVSAAAELQTQLDAACARLGKPAAQPAPADAAAECLAEDAALLHVLAAALEGKVAALDDVSSVGAAGTAQLMRLALAHAAACERLLRRAAEVSAGAPPQLAQTAFEAVHDPPSAAQLKLFPSAPTVLAVCACCVDALDGRNAALELRPDATALLPFAAAAAVMAALHSSPSRRQAWGGLVRLLARVIALARDGGSCAHAALLRFSLCAVPAVLRRAEDAWRLAAASDADCTAVTADVQATCDALGGLCDWLLPRKVRVERLEVVHLQASRMQQLTRRWLCRTRAACVRTCSGCSTRHSPPACSPARRPRRRRPLLPPPRLPSLRTPRTQPAVPHPAPPRPAAGRWPRRC